jgi:hypothetical protein
MVRKKIFSIIAGGALVLVSVFGAATYQIVKAQVAATATPAASAPAQTAPGRGMGVRYSDADLATALNITAAQLKTAQQTATTEAIKQAVAAGLITQAQADQYTQNSSNGLPDGGGMPWLKSSTINYDDLLAKALGITTDQLKAGYLKAYETNLALAVTNGTMTQDQADAAKASYVLQNNTDYQNALKTGYETAVNQAVTSGLITQAQADEVLKNNNGLGMIGAGGGGRSGGPGGMMGVNPGNLAGSTSSSSTKTDFITLLAKALGITTDQYKAAYQQATSASLDQAVQDGTMTQAQAVASKANNALANSSEFQTAVKAAQTAAIKQAVTGGVITQAQADLIATLGLSNGMPGAGAPGGPGGRGGGPGGPGGQGGPGGNPPANNGNSNSTGTTNP